MPIFGKNTDDIERGVISQLRSETNLTRFDSGTKTRAIVKALNQELGTAYSLFDLNMATAFISGARGEFLDLLAELFGLTRQSPRPSRTYSGEKSLKFYTYAINFGAINSNRDIQIPRGAIITTNAFGERLPIQYRLTEDAVLPADQKQWYVAGESVSVGAESHVGTNVLVNHNFTNYTDAANNSLLITNVAPINNGINIEDDNMFRYRIVNKVLTGEAANSTAIRLAALSTPGVADVKELEYYRGIGTSDWVIKSTIGYVSQDLVAAVQSVITNIRADGSSILARAPVQLGMQFALTLYYRPGTLTNDKTAIEVAVMNAIKDYVIQLDIGEMFVVNELVQRIMDADERIKDVGLPNKPIDFIYLYRDGTIGRIKSILLGNYAPGPDEKLVIEPSVTDPITIGRT